MSTESDEALGPAGPSDDRNNIIQFRKREDSEPTLSVVNRKHDTCKHEAVFVDDVLRRITCQSCSEVLDPVQVLLEFAHRERHLKFAEESWAKFKFQQRMYEWDERWKRDIKGKIFTRPTDGDAATVWDEFARYFSKDPVCIYRSRRAPGGWYGAYRYELRDGASAVSHVSIEAAREANRQNTWRSAAQASADRPSREER